MAVLNRHFHTYIKQKNCNPSLIKRNTVTALSISLLSPLSPLCSDNAVLPSRTSPLSAGTFPSPPVTDFSAIIFFVLKHSIDVGMRVIDADQLFTTITVNEPAPGLKIIFNFRVPDQRSGKVEVQYKNLLKAAAATANSSRDKSAAAANTSQVKSAAAANSSRDKSAASNSSQDKSAAASSSRDKSAAVASSFQDKSAASSFSRDKSAAAASSSRDKSASSNSS
nr:mitochondrial outer membrane protein porin of 36 kDa-like [Arachis hypogaea]